MPMFNLEIACKIQATAGCLSSKCV